MIYLNKAIIKWLTNIIHERFSRCIYFHIQKDRFVISCKGYSNSIVFDVCNPDFFVPDHVIPFTTWNSEEEGYNSLIEKNIPAPGFESLKLPVIRNNGGDYIISYDIPGLVYWMLNRVEEINSVDNDQYDRFPAKNSHAYKYGYLNRPIIDEWMGILRQVIHKQWPEIQVNEHKFSVRPSHDVDRPARYYFCSPIKLLDRFVYDLRTAQSNLYLRAPFSFLTSKKSISRFDPFNSFNWIMDVSEKHGLVSAFFFLCGITNKQYDADYHICHSAVRSLMKDIHARGHEIGLHPSFNTYDDNNAINKEADALRKAFIEEDITQKVLGGRMHYLRWSHPSTLLAWEGAGMGYDSTLGYADIPGFRCGTCYEYPAFDPVSYVPLKIRIRPLIVMENSIIGVTCFDKKTDNESLEVFLDLKNKCKRVSGTFTLLWHNNHLINRNQKELYLGVIQG